MIRKPWSQKPPAGVALNRSMALTDQIAGWSCLEGAYVAQGVLPFDHLVPIGGAGWAQGPDGPVLACDASGLGWRKQGLIVSLNGQTNASMAVRYKPASLSTGASNDYLMSFSTGGGGGNGFDFRQNDGNLLFDISTSSTDSIGPFSQALTVDWHTSVLVFNGSDGGGMSYAFYHDGVLRATDFINLFATGTLDVADNEVNLGNFSNAFSAFWSGQIAWAYYWPWALSSRHAKQLHEQPYSIFAPRMFWADVPSAAADVAPAPRPFRTTIGARKVA